MTGVEAEFSDFRQILDEAAEAQQQFLDGGGVDRWWSRRDLRRRDLRRAQSRRHRSRQRNRHPLFIAGPADRYAGDIIGALPIDIDDPDLVAKVNAGWWMATEYGLFDEQREFLLSLGREDPDAEAVVTGWARVRLLDRWDLAGSGVLLLVSAVTGRSIDRFVPDFTMASRDGRMVLETTLWGNGTVSTLVVRPDRLTAEPGRPRTAP